MWRGTINTFLSSSSATTTTTTSTTTQRSGIRGEGRGGRGGKRAINPNQSSLSLFFPSHLSTCLSYLSSAVSFFWTFIYTSVSQLRNIFPLLLLSLSVCLFLVPPCFHLLQTVVLPLNFFSFFVSHSISSSQSTTSSIYIRDCVIGCCKNTGWALKNLQCHFSCTYPVIIYSVQITL